MDTARRQHWIRLLSVEGYVANVWAEASEGMSPDDDIFIAEFEYDLPDD